MKKFCCQHIDDYLDGDLPKEKLPLFLRSLDECGECQLTIESAEKIESRLKMGWNQVDAPAFDPSQFKVSKPAQESCEDPRKAPQQTPIIGSFGLMVVAASMLLVIGGVIYSLTVGFQSDTRDENNLADHNTEKTNTTPIPDSKSGDSQSSKDRLAQSSNTSSPQSQSLAKATVEFPDSYLGVRIDEPDDDFTFINVYETVNTKPKSQSNNLLKDQQPSKKEKDNETTDAA